MRLLQGSWNFLWTLWLQRSRTVTHNGGLCPRCSWRDKRCPWWTLVLFWRLWAHPCPPLTLFPKRFCFHSVTSLRAQWSLGTGSWYKFWWDTVQHKTMRKILSTSVLFESIPVTETLSRVLMQTSSLPTVSSINLYLKPSCLECETSRRWKISGWWSLLRPE